MKENIKVVIIDDHPLITRAYKEALEIIFYYLKILTTLKNFCR